MLKFVLNLFFFFSLFCSLNYKFPLIVRKIFIFLSRKEKNNLSRTCVTLGFKRCLTCRLLIPVSDRHSQCVYCLDETHLPQRRSHCHNLKSQTRKARDLQLKLLLMEKCLRPASEPETNTSESDLQPRLLTEAPLPQLRSRSNPLKNSGKKKKKKWATTSPVWDFAKKWHSPNWQSATVLTAPAFSMA